MPPIELLHGFTGKRGAQPAIRNNVQQAMNITSAHVAVHQQNALALLREYDRAVDAGRRFALTRQGTRYQEHFRRSFGVGQQNGSPQRPVSVRNHALRSLQGNYALQLPSQLRNNPPMASVA